MSTGDKPRGINILCIDGGGARGLSSLVLLGEVMGRVGELEGRYEQPDPAEYFDVIAGSGTGGVSACMLGRLRMSLKQTISAYAELVSEVFSNKRIRGADKAGANKGAQLEEALKSLVRNATGNEGEHMRNETSGRSPKTIVLAMSRLNLNASAPILFRSYESARSPAPDCTIWEALYATMAHPDLFRSIEIHDGPIPLSFVGGEIGCCNPIAHVLSETSKLYPDRYVSCVLSIGAGHARTIALPDPSQSQRLLNIQEAKAMKDMATDSEREAEVMAARFQCTKNLYYRFNVDQGMQDMNADDWEKLGEIMAHTRAYIDKVEPNRGIDRAARAVQERKPVLVVKYLDGRVQVTSGESVARIKHCPAPSSIFTGREDRIQQISTCIAGGNGERRVCVIYGLSGAGKTQLALKTIEKDRHNWTHILYVDASSKETIEDTLQAIAAAKGVGPTYEDALKWLAGHQEPWLLVYDNADDPSLSIHKYFPSSNRGSILITTRLADMTLHARGPSSECRVSEMNQEDAIALLLRLTGIQGQNVTASEMEAATALLEDFGHFALAIVHAGAYIGHSHMSVSEYRRLFLAHRRSMLERYKKLKVKIDDYQWTVFTTWKLCYDMLEESGDSRQLLWLIAFLHHDRIALSIFERAAVNIKNYKPLLSSNNLESNAHEHVRGFLSRFLDEKGQWDASLFSDAISELAAYSLLKYDRLNAVYSTHVLVQEWARTVIPQAPDLALECATTLLAHAVDRGNSVQAHMSRLDLGLHVIKVLSEQHDAVSANHALSFARVYKTMGLWDRKESLELQAREARARELGTDHLGTLVGMKELTSTYRKQGRWSEAEQLDIEVLDTCRRTLGQEHPDTLTSMNNLALTYWKQGRWREAERLQVKVLGTRRQILGETHRETLMIMGNLAATYWSQGRWGEAEKLEVKVLNAHGRTSGEEHPDTLTCMNNLALTYWKQGQWDKAEQLQAKVLVVHRRALGEQHPDTLTSMGNLASTYRAQGRWGEAEQLQIKVLGAYKQLQGEEHPDTLTSMNNLASTYRAQGRGNEAEQLQTHVLDTRRRNLGDEHPDTLTSMNNLALAYLNQAQLDKAEQLQLKVLDVRRRTQGEAHPSTLTSMNNLASTYWDLDRWDEAEQLQLKVLDTRKRTLGEEHPDTLMSIANLASIYWDQGRWDEAEQLEIKVMGAHRRALGEEHPDTLTIMHNLALTQADQGRWDEAERLLAQVAEARARVIGDQHPYTASSREELARVRRQRATSEYFGIAVFRIDPLKPNAM